MILITGGAGYIGSHINKLLNSRGIETIVFDNLVHGHAELVRWGTFIHADLAQVSEVRRCFERFPITAVVHLAGYISVNESIALPARYYHNNLVTTLNLLDAMIEHGVRHIIFSSSCAVYGNPIVVPITEDHPRDPQTPYGRSKYMVEEILEDYRRAYDINYVSLRYFNAAGADGDGEIGEWHEPETHLIPIVLEAAANSAKTVQVYGDDYPTRDGTCIRDYIHVMDLAEAHRLALEYLLDNGNSTVFNLGNGEGFTIMEVVEAARRVTGHRIPTTVAPRRPGDPPALIGNSSRAKQSLGWTPQLSSIDCIIETAWNWRKNRG